MALTNGTNLVLLANGAQGEFHYTDLMKQWRGLDALVQANVIDNTLTTPPGSPANGDCYIPATGATGAWSGKANTIARYSTITVGWEFYTPRTGWEVFVVGSARFRFTGTTWDSLAVVSQFKGVYTTLGALQAAHPTGTAGDYGQVDSGAGGTFNTYMWDVQDGWVLALAVPSSETVASMGTLIGGATSKSPPIDADSWAILDSISGLMQRVTGTNLKAYLKTYFDTLYASVGGGSETVVTLGNLIEGATAKTTPVDADLLALSDSAATGDVKKFSWLNLKATLKTYFDTLYKPVSLVKNSQSTAYTTVLTDTWLDHPSTDTNARTFTIDSNANVAYPVGTLLNFTNMTSQVLSIAITTDTMYLGGTATTGTRALAQNGVATAIKQSATVWIITGAGLT